TASVDIQFRIREDFDGEPGQRIRLYGTSVQSGWHADFCATYHPARPKAPDEDERHKTKDDCLEWLVAFLKQFGVNIDGCQTAEFLDQLITDPVGAFDGLTARTYKSENYPQPTASMGWGWSFGIDARVETNDAGDLIYRNGGSFERWAL